MRAIHRRARTPQKASPALARRAPRPDNSRMNLRGLLICPTLFAIACSSNSERRDVQSAGSSSVAPATPLAAAASPSPAAITSPRAIAALRTRDHTVRVYSDGGSLRVTVLDDAGQLVADRITLEDLRTIDPFLYQACTNAVAAAGASRGTFVDARLYMDDVAMRAP